MTPIFKKLNFKNQSAVFAINAPTSFDAELNAMKECPKTFKTHTEGQEVDFAILFFAQKKQIKTAVSSLFDHFIDDTTLWFSYPKASSKNYTCDFNRDNGWHEIGDLNLEPVRQVSIDQDWSALRFRKTEYIKKITRRKDFAISLEDKKRTKGK